MKLVLFLFFSLLPCFIWSAETGDKAPECTLPLVNNNDMQLSISQLRGKVVYLDFWASWCPPCEKSFPVLESLHQDFHDKGLEVIAVNLDEDPALLYAFLEDHPVNFNIVYDGKGVCPESYQVMAMPSSYIIDQKGTIQHVNLGFQLSETEKIRDKITSLLNED